ncbi:hypothetical protein GCM10010872_09850 [Dyella flava]|nr:hypothetical protein GCM10010872_09850 [Dyella flava]
MQRFTTSAGIAYVYATNIPGIGIRVSYPNPVSVDTLSWSGNNNSTINNPGPGEGIGTATLATVEWIKTATTVGNGTISAGTVGIVMFNSVQIASINLIGATNIVSPTPPTCSVNANSTQTVSLGAYTTTQFTGVGSMTPAKAFNVNFNCSGGTAGQSTRVYITMTDATVPANRTNNLNLAAGSTASGVAVRIRRNSGATDVLFGADSATIGNANQWQAGTVATGTNTFSVPLQASMIQTGALATGSVSAKATFTVAYN